ncbi:MAG: zf-HC2 domain-containing protein [Lachnospiraceae bacterium]|nr:zf-HC2 domain-containing protein [Lachnospiraceae bacterium]
MQCSEVQMLITSFLENNLTLDQKWELVRHIRGCSQCRSELEFYFVVYDTIGKFGDQTVYRDYEAAVERLLLQVEKEHQQAIRTSRLRRFRLTAFFALLAVWMSLGIQADSNRKKPNVLMVSELSGAQQNCMMLRQSVYAKDIPMLHTLKPGGNLEYELVEQPLARFMAAGEELTGVLMPVRKTTEAMSVDGAPESVPRRITIWLSTEE